MTDSADDLLGWCVVANVAEPGLKHFVAGAKLWVLPVIWGDGGDSLYVIGRHRGAHKRGYLRIVVQRKSLTNFRVQGIYSPAVVKAAEGHHLWESRFEAEKHAAWWNMGDEAWTAGGYADWLAERAATRGESSRPG